MNLYIYLMSLCIYYLLVLMFFFLANLSRFQDSGDESDAPLSKKVRPSATEARARSDLRCASPALFVGNEKRLVGDEKRCV